MTMQVKKARMEGTWARSMLAPLYRAYTEKVHGKLMSERAISRIMPAATFAKNMVKALKVKNPPILFRDGTGVWAVRFAKLLPFRATDGGNRAILGLPKKIVLGTAGTAANGHGGAGGGR